MQIPAKNKIYIYIEMHLFSLSFWSLLLQKRVGFEQMCILFCSSFLRALKKCRESSFEFEQMFMIHSWRLQAEPRLMFRACKILVLIGLYTIVVVTCGFQLLQKLLLIVYIANISCQKYYVTWWAICFLLSVLYFCCFFLCVTPGQRLTLLRQVVKYVCFSDRLFIRCSHI